MTTATTLKATEAKASKVLYPSKNPYQKQKPDRLASQLRTVSTVFKRSSHDNNDNHDGKIGVRMRPILSKILKGSLQSKALERSKLQ